MWHPGTGWFNWSGWLSSARFTQTCRVHPYLCFFPPPLMSAHLLVYIKASSQLQESLVTTQERATQSAVAGCHRGCPAPLPRAEGSPAALPARIYQRFFPEG